MTVLLKIKTFRYFPLEPKREVIFLAQKCTVCNHINAAEINKKLIEKIPLETLSKAYGLSVTALHRHKKHIPAHLTKAQEAKETAAADSLMNRVAGLNTKAEEIYSKALEADNLTAAVAAVRELRGITELYAKITGELTAQTVNNIIIMPEWLTLRTAILNALELYPEARQAVIEAVGRVEA
jgi:primosomal protein N'